MKALEPLDAKAGEDAVALKHRIEKADADTLALLLTEARTHYGWHDRAVSDEQLKELYDIAKMGPTSMNQQPMRLLFVQSIEAKEKLAPTLNEPNARETFFKNPVASATNAFRNGTLQGAYLMLAARAMGLNVGGMSGFNNALVDELFLAGTTWKSNFLCNIGYADESKIFRRLPRLPFEKIVRII